MRVVIIDDDAFNLDLIRTFCTRFATGLEVIDTAQNVNDGIQAVLKYQPDILFLDVELHDQTGFEVLKSVHQPNLMVIMVTAFAEYAVDAFKVNVVDYLLKPLLIPDFTRAIEKCRHLHELRGIEKQNIIVPTTEYTQFISAQVKGQVLLIEVEHIIRFEADGSYTKVYISDSEFHVVAKGLSQIEDGLSPAMFIRTHHSHIVNINFIKMLLRQKEFKLELKDGSEVPIAERRRKEVLGKLGISA